MTYRLRLGLALGVAMTVSATANGQTFTSADTPLGIPAGGGTLGVTTSEITVGGQGTIADVNVNLDLNHTFSGDLEASVTSPTGTIVNLFDNVGGGSNLQNGGYLFDDEASAAYPGAGNPVPTGSYRPLGSLSNFDGEAADGTWRLTINDTLGGDSGTLNFWELIFTTNRADTSGAGVRPALRIAELQANSRFLDTIARRFRNNGSAHGPFAQSDSPAFEYSPGRNSIQLASYDAETGEATLSENPFDRDEIIIRGQNCNCPRTRSVWFSGYGANGNVKQATDYNFEGGILGIEDTIGPNWTVGLAVNIYGSQVGQASAVAASKTQGAALYFNRRTCDYYLTGMVGHNRSEYDSRRQTITGQAVGQFAGDASLALIEIGTDGQLRSWTARPHMAFQYVHLNLDGYTEVNAGASNLTVGEDNIDSARIITGVDLTRGYEARGRLITPVVRAAVVSEVGNGSNNVFMSGVGGPNLIRGVRLGEDYADLGVGATMVANRFTTLYSNYDYQVSHRHHQHTWGAGLSLNW